MQLEKEPVWKKNQNFEHSKSCHLAPDRYGDDFHSTAYFIFSGTGCDDVLQKSTIVAGLELVIKLVIYYLHEQAWQSMPGTVRHIFKRTGNAGGGLGK